MGRRKRCPGHRGRISGGMCSGSEAGSYLRLVDFVYHSTLGFRVKKKKKKVAGAAGADKRVEGEFFIDNLLVPLHLIIVMIR